MELFEQGKIKLYRGDCMELLRATPDGFYDLCVVDPPYGLGDKLTSGGTWSVKWQDKGAKWDKTPEREYFDQLLRVCKNWIVFGGNYFIEHLPNCRHFIAWHKPYMDGMHSMSNVELALTSFDANAKKISINKDKGNEERIHVCQKPTKLYQWVFDHYATPDMKILDTHLGSGSSAIAAHYFGCEFTGIEIDQDYYKAAVKRFIENTKQQDLFKRA